MSGEVVNGLEVDVMGNGQEILSLRIGIAHRSVHSVLCILLQLWGDIVVVIGVQIEIGNVVSKISHVLRTA